MNAASTADAGRGQAAFIHIAVSNALLISGMFMPKLAVAAAAFAAAVVLLLLPASLPVLVGATSVARSHDPFSWERATEKNRST
jgi:hypothetical protein